MFSVQKLSFLSSNITLTVYPLDLIHSHWKQYILYFCCCRCFCLPTWKYLRFSRTRRGEASSRGDWEFSCLHCLQNACFSHLVCTSIFSYSNHPCSALQPSLYTDVFPFLIYDFALLLSTVSHSSIHATTNDSAHCFTSFSITNEKSTHESRQLMNCGCLLVEA